MFSKYYAQVQSATECTVHPHGTRKTLAIYSPNNCLELFTPKTMIQDAIKTLMSEYVLLLSNSISLQEQSSDWMKSRSMHHKQSAYLQLTASNINHPDQLRKHQSAKESINVSLESHCASNWVHLARRALQICSKATYPKNGRTRARTRDDRHRSAPFHSSQLQPCQHQLRLLNVIAVSFTPHVGPWSPAPFGTHYPTSTEATEIPALKYNSVFHGWS